MPSYLESLKQQAQTQLHPIQFAALHASARGAAGGSAPRPSTLYTAELRFDPTIFSASAAAAWAKKNGYEPGTAMSVGDEWVIPQPNAPATANQRRRPLGAGVYAMVGQKESVSKSERVLGAMRAMWSDMVGALIEKSEAPEEAVAANLDLFNYSRLVAGGDHEFIHGADTPEAGITMARQRLAKSAEAYDDQRDAYSFHPDVPGLDVHLCCGDAREPGHIGVDTFPHDEFTQVHDIGVGLPFADGSVRSLVVPDTITALDLMAPAALVDEAQRVLCPDGVLLWGTREPIAKSAIKAEFLTPIIDDHHEDPLAQDPEQLAAAEVLEAGEDPADPDELIAHLIAKSEVHVPGGHDPIGLMTIAPSMRARIAKSVPTGSLPFVGSSKQKQIVYSVVLAPMEVDTWDHIMTPEEIEYTAHRYMEESRLVNSEHGDVVMAAQPVESFIAPQDLTYDHPVFGKQEVKKGSWVMGVKIRRPQDWAKVLSGEYTGFSIQGNGLLQNLTSN